LPDRLRTPAQRIGNVRIELPDEGISLEKVERELILTALEKHDWNQTRAAAYLDVTRSTLLYRMQKYALEREKAPADAAPEGRDAQQQAD
jgi:two-component system NtrC family response regulator